jgi:hypothetical protein
MHLITTGAFAVRTRLSPRAPLGPQPGPGAGRRAGSAAVMSRDASGSHRGRPGCPDRPPDGGGWATTLPAPDATGMWVRSSRRAPHARSRSLTTLGHPGQPGVRPKHSAQAGRTTKFWCQKS